MIDRVYDISRTREQGVGLDFLQRLGYRFLSKRTSDLFEGEELGGAFILNEVDIGESALIHYQHP